MHELHEVVRPVGVQRVHQDPQAQDEGHDVGDPDAKSFRVTFRGGQWHIAFAVIPCPTPAPGTGEVVGIDRGVTITAALSDGRKLNCP